MVLAEDLERRVVRRASLVNEIVDALLPGYQFFPLLKAGLGLCRNSVKFSSAEPAALIITVAQWHLPNYTKNPFASRSEKPINSGP